MPLYITLTSLLPEYTQNWHFAHKQETSTMCPLVDFQPHPHKTLHDQNNAPSIYIITFLENYSKFIISLHRFFFYFFILSIIYISVFFLLSLCFSFFLYFSIFIFNFYKIYYLKYAFLFHYKFLHEYLHQYEFHNFLHTVFHTNYIFFITLSTDFFITS